MLRKWRQTKLQQRMNKKKVVDRPVSMLRTQITVGLCITIVLGLVITGVWYGTRVASLQITEVSIVGGYTIPHPEIEEKVRQRLTGTYFLLVPHTFRLFYPENAIIENIKSIARVKNVHLELVEGQELAVVFEEYRPYALWCESHDTKECLFLDEFGFAFSEAPDLTGGAFVRYIDTEHTPERKTQAFESTFIKNTQSFVEMLADELDLYVTHVEKVQDLDVEYTVSGGGVLKVSQLVDMEKSFDNLKAILNSEDFIHLQNGAFQYIDLRFGDKIFLNEEGVLQDTASSTNSEG